VANGLNALHRCRILHSDVKSENVLVFKSEDGEFLAKVSDFGSSLPDCGDGSLRSRISVTKPWNAPETENGGEVSHQNMWKTDIFSYGMLCWRTILESKCHPFTISEASQSQAIQKLKKEDKLIETAVIGIRELNALDEAAHLLQILDCTLQLDPFKRIGTFERVIEILTSDVALQKKNKCQKYVHFLILLYSSLTET
jgi:serine/threonine protein kinase